MKLSTYIKAARKAETVATDAAVRGISAPWDKPTHQLAYRKYQQADKFHARAVQLADEQHDLILTQDAQLDQFAQALQEVA